MSDMFPQDDYKQLLSQIKTPASLKEKTLLQMEKEEKLISTSIPLKKGPKKKKVIWLSSLATLAAVLALFIGVQRVLPQTSITNNPFTSEHQEEITLENATLHFETVTAEEVFFMQNPYALGVPPEDSFDSSESEVFHPLFPAIESLKNYTVIKRLNTSHPVTAKDREDATTAPLMQPAIALTYQNTSSETRFQTEILYKVEFVIYPEYKTNSSIGEFPLFLSYDTTEGQEKYHAYFEYKDFSFFIESPTKETSQEEFVLFLLEFIDNLVVL